MQADITIGGFAALASTHGDGAMCFDVSRYLL